MSHEDKDASLSVELEAALAGAKVLWEEEKNKELLVVTEELNSLKSQLQELTSSQETANKQVVWLN